jgi:hypothetical protein
MTISTAYYNEFWEIKYGDMNYKIYIRRSSMVNFFERQHNSEFHKKREFVSKINSCLLPKESEPGSSGSIVSGYGLQDRAIEVRSSTEAKGFFLYPLCPDRLWGPPSLLYNGYRESLPRG